MTPEERYRRRMWVNTHNGYVGTAGLIYAHLRRLANAKSLTPEARHAVEGVMGQMAAIQNNIRHFRVEEDGVVTRVNTSRS